MSKRPFEESETDTDDEVEVVKKKGRFERSESSMATDWRLPSNLSIVMGYLTLLAQESKLVKFAHGNEESLQMLKAFRKNCVKSSVEEDIADPFKSMIFRVGDTLTLHDFLFGILASAVDLSAGVPIEEKTSPAKSQAVIQNFLSYVHGLDDFHPPEKSYVKMSHFEKVDDVMVYGAPLSGFDTDMQRRLSQYSVQAFMWTVANKYIGKQIHWWSKCDVCTRGGSSRRMGNRGTELSTKEGGDDQGIEDGTISGIEDAAQISLHI